MSAQPLHEKPVSIHTSKRTGEQKRRVNAMSMPRATEPVGDAAARARDETRAKKIAIWHMMATVLSSHSLYGLSIVYSPKVRKQMMRAKRSCSIDPEVKNTGRPTRESLRRDSAISK